MLCESHHDEGSDDNHERAPSDHGVPLGGSLLLPVVVEPHAAIGLEAEEGTEESTDEGDERAEDGDGRGDDVGESSDTDNATHPGDPVLGGVGGKILSSSEDSDEGVLGSQLDGC